MRIILDIPIGLVDEIESLNTARNQEEATLRKRRRDFYLRNQVQLSQVVAQAFDVEYQMDVV